MASPWSLPLTTGPAIFRIQPIFVLGGGLDQVGPAYQHPPSWDLHGFDSDDIPLGYVGRRAARKAFDTAGLSPGDVDLCEF